ncbi:ComF family protein [Candidatus Acetothermia bacterium]|nr:ComF family protein [Candidatus Acetothermia bacterium]MBI3643788.1 ComF family protein [Candidatus Acetothermia bacterium]
MKALERAKRAGSGALWGTLGLLYPPCCALCDSALEPSQKHFACPSCLMTIQAIRHPWCLRCGDPLETPGIDLCERCAHESVSFDWAQSVALYDGVLARLIQKLKYEQERALVHELAPLLEKHLQDEQLADQFDAITFVPMSRKSLQRRGFNQSELLAKRVGKLVAKPLLFLLQKIRETRSQMELSGEERRQNLQGAFIARPHPTLKRVLILDDVYTTGATARECSRALRECGWEQVMVLTLARTPIARSEPNAH